MLLALYGLGFGLLALAWDGGTDRVLDDYLIIGISLAFLIAAAGLLLRQRWSLGLLGGAGALLALLAVALSLAGG